MKPTLSDWKLQITPREKFLSDEMNYWRSRTFYAQAQMGLLLLIVIAAMIFSGFQGV